MSKVPFHEWYQAIMMGKEPLGWTTTPIDKNVYAPYCRQNGVPVKVLAPSSATIDSSTIELIDRVASQNNVIVLLQMLPSNQETFFRMNYELYAADSRAGHIIKFSDILLFRGGEDVKCCKHHIDTPEKFQKFIEKNFFSSDTPLCSICLEETSSGNCCGSCHKTFCRECSAQWYATKGLKVSCPTCRAKPKISVVTAAGVVQIQ